MDVTEVDIALVKPREGLIAFASVVLDDQVYLGSIGVHRKLDGSGYRLTYPTRRLGERLVDVFHPIRRPIGVAIEQAIVAKLKDVMSRGHAGYDRTDAGSPAV